MNLDAVNYQLSYFKYKTPTLMQGVPAHKACKRLKTEQQANGSSIETDLGGGKSRLSRISPCR